ncbi:hypothetical protein RT717_00965 [Imperialibacter roseus]|uniref:Lipoprotein n=1 Tax=Imperialibacter roseus TaxID=1324217 RepID=A0ABZ0IS36_9BACT|nr:hypothetical protein [Imperialibacter roseus]WOK07190.1 hypothetical protein RT717_00965 [Imperialibacter roseus]
MNDIKYHNLTRLAIFSVFVLFFFGCSLEASKEKNTDNREGTVVRQDTSQQTRRDLCEVASFLEMENFSGDFYVYGSNIQFTLGTDSILIPKEIIVLLQGKNIEYVARSRGIIEFGFNPTGNGESGLLLNTEPNNPAIDSGNVRPEFTKLSNETCLGLNWYYQTFR